MAVFGTLISKRERGGGEGERERERERERESFDFDFDYIGMKISGRGLVFRSVPAILLYKNIYSQHENYHPTENR